MTTKVKPLNIVRSVIVLHLDLLASRFGCNCAQCLVDMRDVAQFFRRDQKWSDTQRALYNDREGRDCAGCRGKGRVGGPLFGFRSDDAIKKCCFFKVVSRKLYTNNPKQEYRHRIFQLCFRI